MSEPPLPARSPLRPRGNPKQGRTPTPEQAPATKRQHALHELLASEQAYASDLAIVRQVHVPLALGRSIQIDSTLLTSTVETPMTADDVKVIFSNIEDVSKFADQFCDALRVAIEEERVGELFLKSIPDMERPYKVYISKREAASRHYHSLPTTTALAAYHAQTRTIASQMSHAWDLQSMLIKPVQRLLKYPLLLATICEETLDDHPDKENLRLAKDAVQDLAYRVNEERRRAEVVKDVMKRSNKDLLVRIKNLKPAPQLDSGESQRIAHYHSQFLHLQTFVNQLAQNILHWSHCVTTCTTELHVFSQSFANAVGLSCDVQSDSFDTFMGVLTNEIIPMTTTLSESLSVAVLTPLSSLLANLNGPLHLLETLQTTLLPLHTHLMHMPISSKNRPPPELIKASADYMALRGKLAEETPIYLSMSEKVLSGCIQRLARVQKEHFQRTHLAWRRLWTRLCAEGDDLSTGNAVKVWWNRWEEVDTAISRLHFVQQPTFLPTPPITPSSSSRTSATSSSLSPKPTVVTSVLSSLDPGPPRSPSSPLSPSSGKSASGGVKHKGRRAGTAYEYDIGYEYVASSKVPLDAVKPAAATAPKARKKKSKGRERPSTSSGSPTSASDIHRKLSFMRKASDPSMKETKEVLYLVQSAYAFEPPPDPRVAEGQKSRVYLYDSYPFLVMKGEGEVFEVLKVAGHPREHLSRGLMLYVHDEDSEEPDSLLLLRRRSLKGSKQKAEHGEVGWALASYLQPLSTLPVAGP